MNCGVQRKTLLLGENIDLLLRLQVSCQGNQRFDIHTACSGLKVLDLVHEINPDLIMLDLLMPDMKGDVVCRILKADARTSSVPIIVLGSSDEKDASKRALAAGVEGLIIKPASRELLLSTIECCLGIKIRRQARADVTVPGTLVLDDTEMETTIHNLSTLGAFAEVGEGEAIAGDLVELRFCPPGSEKDVMVKNADVIWLGNFREGGPFGSGVRFLDIHPESSFLIALYLEPFLRKDHPGKAETGRFYGPGTKCSRTSCPADMKEET